MRLLRAIENPYCNIIAHPSTRLLGKREACEIEWGQIWKAARESFTALEVNGQPDRLDLSSHLCRSAIDEGVNLTLASDAHNTQSLDFIRFAVDQARRGWVCKNQVLNSRPWTEIEKIFRKKSK